MSLHRSAIVAALAVALVVALAACPGDGSRGDGPSPSPAASPQGRPGGTLRIALADDAGALDPQLAGEPGAFGLVRATQRGLTAFPSTAGEAGSAPVPDLAEAPPEVSADGRTYTFRLRAGVRFGAPASRTLVAADVVAGLERALRLGGAGGAFRAIAGADAFLGGRARTVGGLVAVDARTVRVSLARPANDLLWMLATPAASAVPPGLGNAVTPRQISPSGPYRLEAWEPGERIRLVRNDAWDRSSDPIRRAWVDAIEAVVGPADGADLTGEGVRPSGATQNVEGGCLLYLFLNIRVGPFGTWRVRRGVSLAVDRAAIAAALARVNGAPARATGDLLPPGAPGTMPDRTAPAANPAEARRLIGSAFSTRLGYERRGPDAVADAAIAAELTAALGRAGVRTSPLLGAGAIGPSAYDVYEAGRAPMGVARWCPDWPGRSARVTLGALVRTRGVANYSNIADPELDRLIAAATEAPGGLSPGAPAGSTPPPGPVEAGPVATAYDRAETRALGLVTIVPLAFYEEAAQVSRRVRGFVAHPLFTRGDPANVWLAA